MNQAVRRREARLRLKVEALETRALLASAGSLDPSFGAGRGSVTAPLDVPVASSNSEGTGGSGYVLQSESVATLPDGNIVVSGPVVYDKAFGDVATIGSAAALAIVELNPNGTPDTSFGDDGRVFVPITPNEPSLQVAIAPTGQIILANTINQGTANVTYFVAELNADGTIDTSFGTDGVAEYPADTTTSATDRISALVGVFVQSGGQILLAGGSGGGFSAVELNADGSLDTSYGTDGTATVPVSISVSSGLTEYSYPTAAAMQPGGQIVLTGDVSVSHSMTGEPSSDEIVATRLTASGTLDTTFGGPTAAGILLIPYNQAAPGTGLNYTTAMALQPTTGDILVAGYQGASFTGTSHTMVYALTANGAIDTTFGGTGSGLTVLAGASGIGVDDMAVQANGDILLSGRASYSLNGGGDCRHSRLGVQERVAPAQPRRDAGRELRQHRDPRPAPDQPELDPPDPGDRSDHRRHSPGGHHVGPFAHRRDLRPHRRQHPPCRHDRSGRRAGPAGSCQFPGLGLLRRGGLRPDHRQLHLPVSPSLLLPRFPSTVAVGITGAGQTIPAVADYQGLGFDQVAAYLPTSGVYAILPTYGASVGLFEKFGVPGAGQTIPVPADYYGTGQADVAVYIPSQAVFAIQDPTGKTAGESLAFGIPGVGRVDPGSGGLLRDRPG